MRKTAFLVLLAALLGGLALHADDKTSQLEFTILKQDNGKPIRNAAVVLHPIEKNGRAANTGIELKTDPEGKASFPAAPYGKLRIQVLARGFQTFGDDYEINQPVQKIVIKLKRPQGQYSIYEDKPSQEKPKK